MISRLRMGHTGLNSTLALVGKHENGMCVACDVSETVEHVLFECSKYDDQRNSLFSNIGNRPVSVVDLLEKGLNDNQVFKAVLTFFRAYRTRPQDLVFEDEGHDASAHLRVEETSAETRS